MAGLDFNNILSETVETVERAPIPPAGHYQMVVNGIPRQVDGDTQQRITFMLKGVKPGDDVDPDLLKAYGKIDSVTVPHTFFFDKEDAARFGQTKEKLQRFLFEHLGIPFDISLKEAINQSVNKKCLVEISARPDKDDPTILYTNVKSTAALK